MATNEAEVGAPTVDTASADDQYDKGYLYAAQAVGGVVALITLVLVWITHHYRKAKVIVYAQPTFLLLTLGGFLLVSVGAILYPLDPTDASCVAREWLVLLGYTLGMVPLLVKIAALNKLFKEAEQMRRMTLSPKRLLSIVALVMVLVTVYLIVWTVVDPPARVEDSVLVDSSGGTVAVSTRCASKSRAWRIMALSWNTLLVFVAAVLACRTRRMRQEFNESFALAIISYSHVLFLVVLLILHSLAWKFEATTHAAIFSFLLSFDTFIAMAVYFGPKVMVVVGNQMAVAWAARAEANAELTTETQ